MGREKQESRARLAVVGWWLVGKPAPSTVSTHSTWYDQGQLLGARRPYRGHVPRMEGGERGGWPVGRHERGCEAVGAIFAMRLMQPPAQPPTAFSFSLSIPSHPRPIPDMLLLQACTSVVVWLTWLTRTKGGDLIVDECGGGWAVCSADVDVDVGGLEALVACYPCHILELLS